MKILQSKMKILDSKMKVLLLKNEGSSRRWWLIRRLMGTAGTISIGSLAQERVPSPKKTPELHPFATDFGSILYLSIHNIYVYYSLG